MRKILVLTISLVLMLNITIIPLNASKTDENYVRLHVRANSDSENDQKLKIIVRNAVLEFTSELFSENKANDKKDALKILEKNINKIKNICEETLKSNNSSLEVNVQICEESFDYTEYDTFFLPAGIYDALIVTIGEGVGKNWWCVVYPSVCSSFEGELKTDASLLPDSLHLAKTPTPKNVNVKIDFWIIGAISRLFDSIFKK